MPLHDLLGPLKLNRCPMRLLGHLPYLLQTPNNLFFFSISLEGSSYPELTVDRLEERLVSKYNSAYLN